MKSQKSLARKRLKERNRRKDFLKKKNIRRNNWPTPRFKEEMPVLKPIIKEGKFKGYETIGKKTLMRKGTKGVLVAGGGVLPKSKKFKGKKVIKK